MELTGWQCNTRLAEMLIGLESTLTLIPAARFAAPFATAPIVALALTLPVIEAVVPLSEIPSIWISGGNGAVWPEPA